MATPLQIARAAEKARKQKVDDYKKAIKNMEEDMELFYENQLKREEITTEVFAKSLKERSERYSQYAKDVLNVSYMTATERQDLSREYLIKSEEALTEHYQWVKKAEAELTEFQLKEKEKRRDELDESMQISQRYIFDGNYYSGWKELGDDPVSAFKRVDAKLSKSVFSGDITHEEYYSRLKEFGSQMYADRIENSNRWLEHEREMNRISAQEYIDGLGRMQAYTEEYFASGIISHREYIDNMKILEERIFNEKKAIHKEILNQAEEEKRAVDQVADAKIQALKDQYNAEISAMDKANQSEELSQLKAQEALYASAQTKEGKDRLSSIRERIDQIEDQKRRTALKEDLQKQTDYIRSTAEKKKKRIDKNAAESALDLGLYYDSDGGYKMVSDVKGIFGKVLTEQESFSQKSVSEIDLYNVELNKHMAESTQSLANGILTSFSTFASGINAIKNQIFSDVAAVNSLNFSRFGTSGKAIKTNITYNDYGDKNITGTANAKSLFETLGNLIAKGGRL